MDFVKIPLHTIFGSISQAGVVDANLTIPMSTTQAVPEWYIRVNELSVSSFDTQKVKHSHRYCGWGTRGMNINVRVIPVLSFDGWV